MKAGEKASLLTIDHIFSIVAIIEVSNVRSRP